MPTPMSYWSGLPHSELALRESFATGSPGQFVPFLAAPKKSHGVLESKCTQPTGTIAVPYSLICLSTMMGATKKDAPVCRPEDCFFESRKGSYYTSLTLPMIQREWYQVTPKCKEWQIQVGQTIAIACDGATIPFMDSQESKNNPWYPFRTPWAPVQVLDLYQTPKGRCKMSCRWLYWHTDIKDSIKKNITRMPNHVFEHYTKQSFDVLTALGRIYLSSKDEDNVSSRQCAVRGKDGMPRVFLTCRHGITNNEGKETLETISDWNGGRGVPTSALDRALLLITKPQLSLQQVTRDAMQSIMVEDDDSTVEGCTDKIEDESSSLDEDAQSDSVVVVESSESSCSDNQEEEHVKTPHSTDSTVASSTSLSNAEPFYIDEGVTYYWSLQVPVRKEAYHKKGKIKVDHWTVQVGDLIAVQHDESSKPSRTNPWFPFKSPWSPAQVLALSYNVVNSYLVHVRWLYRCNDFEELDDACSEVKTQLQHDRESSFKIVYEYEVIDVTDLETVLGRVILTSESNPSETFLSTVQDEESIPQAPLICRAMITEEYDSVTPIKDWNRTRSSGLQQLQRGLACLKDARLQKATLAMLDENNCSLSVAPSDVSSLSSPSQAISVIAARKSVDVSMEGGSSSSFGKRRRGKPRKGTKRRPSPEISGRPTKSARISLNNATRELLDKKVDNFVQEEADDSKTKLIVESPISVNSKSTAPSASKGDNEEERIFIPNGLRPFHEDFAALRSYYSEIHVIPPYEVSSPPHQLDSNKEPWRVKLGDMVTVHYKQGSGRTSFGFAEVVTIWKEHESARAMQKSRRKSNLGAQDDMRIEIRWFYRKNELPGSAKTAVSISDVTAKYVEYDEVFETDLMDECKAVSLLGPAKLHESALSLGLSTMQQGMPVIGFHCCRFWSIHRKSLVPCGSMTGRVERGRIHSKYFGKGGVLNTSWREFKADAPGELEPEESIQKSEHWKQSFKEVIENLGLSAASEETSIRGIELTGREAEQEKIMTFLRSRISGAVDEDGSVDCNVSTNASLFVAGRKCNYVIFRCFAALP